MLIQCLSADLLGFFNLKMYAKHLICPSLWLVVGIDKLCKMAKNENTFRILR